MGTSFNDRRSYVSDNDSCVFLSSYTYKQLIRSLTTLYVLIRTEDKF